MSAVKLHNPTKARLNPGRQWIGIKNLEAPDELQPRAGIDKGWVAQLAAWFKDGSQFPPAKVFQLPDGRLMLAEGHHRRWALLDIGETDMLCEIVDGTMDQATEHAAGSNRGDGPKPMGPKDVTRATEMLFKITKWWNRGNRVISNHVGCSQGKIEAIRKRFAVENRLEIPRMMQTERGSFVPRTGKPRRSRAINITWSNHQCATRYKGNKYCAGTEDELRAKLYEVYRDEDIKSGKLKYRNLFNRFQTQGFKGISWNNSYPAFQGLTGHGTVLVSCDFSEPVSLLVSIGNLKLLCAAIGRLEANRQRDRIATRSVVVCFREYGPADAIDFFEQTGVEFMTPDELALSLGANGMTPDEVQASLQGAAE